MGARAARRMVLDAKKMDILGLHRPGFNMSTKTGERFPDRPMMRTLAAYDAPKRADFNHRAEWLDTQSTEMYIGRANKLQVSEREFLSEAQRAHPNLLRPHKQRTGEEAVHPSLEGKLGWNGSTVALTHKQSAQLASAELGRARASRSAGRHRRGESLRQREARFGEEQREHKRAAAKARPATAPLPLNESKAGAYHYNLTKEDFLQMTRQVPAKRVTAWSLGTIG